MRQFQSTLNQIPDYFKGIKDSTGSHDEIENLQRRYQEYSEDTNASCRTTCGYIISLLENLYSILQLTNSSRENEISKAKSNLQTAIKNVEQSNLDSGLKSTILIYCKNSLEKNNIKEIDIPHQYIGKRCN